MSLFDRIQYLLYGFILFDWNVTYFFVKLVLAHDFSELFFFTSFVVFSNYFDHDLSECLFVDHFVLQPVQTVLFELDVTPFTVRSQKCQENVEGWHCYAEINQVNSTRFF